MNFAYLALCKEARLPDYSFHKGHVFNTTGFFFQTWVGQDASVIMSTDNVECSQTRGSIFFFLTKFRWNLGFN